MNDDLQYLLLAPWVLDGAHKAMRDGWDVDLTYLAILPSLLFRMLHNQVWISISRVQNTRSKHRILDKSLDYDQVDRERNWSLSLSLSNEIILHIYKLEIMRLMLVS